MILVMIQRIKLWWRFEGQYYHKDFIQGIKNLWEWFPIIWKDRDWDHHYIYEMIRAKLEKQAYHTYHNGVHVNHKRDAERMLLCVRLIQIQQEELYALEYIEYCSVSQYFIPTDEGKYFELVENMEEDNLDEYFAKYPKQYELVKSKGKDRKYMAMEIAIKNQERSHKLLFKLLERYIGTWWD